MAPPAPPWFWMRIAAERLRHHARGGIDPAAGRKRNDELDRP
jgi:hypothetical protein